MAATETSMVEAFDMEDQGVEAPKASTPALFRDVHWDQGGDMREFLMTLRQDLFNRLDHQQEVLDTLLRPIAKHVTSSSPKSKKEKLPPTTHGSEASSAASADDKKKTKKGRISFTPRIFTSYTNDDLAHAAMANIADANQNRSKYCAEKTGCVDIARDDRSCAERIVKNNVFDLVCALVVISNLIFLGVEVEISISSQGQRQTTIQVIGYAYTLWFLLELCLRIACDGRALFCNEDWMWAWLDVFVVLTSLWEVAVDLTYVFMETEEIGEVVGVSGLKALRIIRITRILKAIRLMRVFRFVMAFRTLITSIIYTLKSLFWACMLLIVIMYVFAVLFTQAVNDFLLDFGSAMTELESVAAGQYFGSLDKTMLTCFMSIAGGVSWGEVLPPLRTISEAWVGLYLIYIAFTYFAVLNVVTGVFCQSAIESAQNDHTTVVHSILKNKELHVEKLRKLFSTLGDSTDGVVTFAAFEEKISSKDVQAYFEVLGLDVDDAWSFFKLLDLDEGGEVEIEEFLMGCLRLRGNARAIDVGKIIHDQTWLIRNVGKFQTYVEVELRRIQEQIAHAVHSDAGHSALHSVCDDNSPAEIMPVY